MSKRSIKAFICKTGSLENDLQKIESFMNEETTGEIYDINVSISNSGSYANYFFYNIFYEKLEINEPKSKQKKIQNIKTSKTKPKLL